jgi:hypothetical protein
MATAGIIFSIDPAIQILKLILQKMSNCMFSDKSISYSNPSMRQSPRQLSETCMRPPSVALDNSNAYYKFIRGPGKSFGA